MLVGWLRPRGLWAPPAVTLQALFTGDWGRCKGFGGDGSPPPFRCAWLRPAGRQQMTPAAAAWGTHRLARRDAPAAPDGLMPDL